MTFQRQEHRHRSLICVADHEWGTALRKFGCNPGGPGNAMGVQDDRRDIVEWHSPGHTVRLVYDQESPIS